MYVEWDVALGGLHKVPDSAKHAWVAFVVACSLNLLPFVGLKDTIQIFWILYIIGMGLIPRQFKQEQQGNNLQKRDDIVLDRPHN